MDRTSQSSDMHDVASLTALSHAELRIADHQRLDAIGPISELYWLRQCEFGAIDHALFPTIAHGQQSFRAFLTGETRGSSWEELSPGIGYGSGFDPNTVLRRFSVYLDTRGDERLEAAYIRLTSAMTGKPPPYAVVENLARHMAEGHPEHGWQYLTELLPLIYRAEPSSLVSSKPLLVELAEATANPEAEVRIYNVLALASYISCELSQAISELDLAAAAAERISEPLLRRTLIALELSNRARIESVRGNRSQALADILNSLRAAPNLDRWCGAFWFHAERAIRIAWDTDSLKKVLQTIDHYISRCLPTELGTDVFYAIRKYRTFVTSAHRPMYEWKQQQTWESIAARCEQLTERYLPGWTHW
jgi:hypothetical protein